MSVLDCEEIRMASDKSTTRERVATYVVVKPLLKTLYDEMKELAKKKPDAALSKTKIKIVNRMLEKCQAVLATEPELEFLDVLDGEGAIAQASDAVLMIGQFVTAMITFRTRYCRNAWNGREYAYCWHVENDELLAQDGNELHRDGEEDEDEEEDGDEDDEEGDKEENGDEDDD
jgi:hypothetical protein